MFFSYNLSSTQIEEMWVYYSVFAFDGHSEAAHHVRQMQCKILPDYVMWILSQKFFISVSIHEILIKI